MEVLGIEGSVKNLLEEQEMVVAWSRDQGACRVREGGGFKTFGRKHFKF